MRLKTLITGLLLVLLSMSAQAQEDVLQIVPTTFAVDGKTKAVAIEMKNSEPYTALQFKLVLPEGISLANRARPYSTLPKNRFPYTEEYDELEDITTTTYEHSVAFGSQDNIVTMVISPNTLAEIKGNSGRIISLYVDLDSDIKDGLYPLIFKDIVFSTTDAKAVRMAEVASYIIVGAPEFKGTIDLSSLNGYLPKDVADATTTLLADAPEVTEVDLSGINEGGVAVSPGNPNTLFHVKAASAYATMQSAQGDNVVADGICERLILTDNHPFASSKDFTATTASYTRTVPAAGWYSLCLPFAAPTPTGVEVERFKAIDVSASTVTFESGTVEAYTPCIFKTESTEVKFEAENVNIAITPTTLSDGQFTGTLSNIPAGGLTGTYALRGDGSGFGKCTANASSTPFRAFIDDVAQARSLSLIHDGETTSITDIGSADNLLVTAANGMCIVTTNGKAQSLVISSLDGRRIATAHLDENESRVFTLPAGIYLFNNSKIIVK